MTSVASFRWQQNNNFLHLCKVHSAGFALIYFHRIGRIAVASALQREINYENMHIEHKYPFGLFAIVLWIQ